MLSERRFSIAASDRRKTLFMDVILDFLLVDVSRRQTRFYLNSG